MTGISAFRPTVATINLKNLAYNFHSARKFIGEDVGVMAVVKADAYGHGAVECARLLVSEGAEWLAVAIPEEAFELRESGITAPILCLGGFWSGQEELLIDHGITPVISDTARANLLDLAARKKGKTLKFHLKIDTGMGRIGVRPEDLAGFLKNLANLKSLSLSGAMTHFAAADDLAFSDFTNAQIDRFEEALKMIYEFGHSPQTIDLANSPAAVVYPRTRSSLARLGGVLYGLGGDVLPNGVPVPDLKPVMSVSTIVSHLKTISSGETIGYGRTFVAKDTTTVATIPIGYHDGIPRMLSNRGFALVRGQRVPIIGRVSMDWITLDVSTVSDIIVGDDVVLIGEQDGAMILAEDIAGTCSTISYEITCGISQRVRKEYIRKEN
ncbi:MAG: alanine racemase [Pyrinomonadaceae bacterium]|nr:alanine racemase [Pyrinomonadaceae bacterium]